MEWSRIWNFWRRANGAATAVTAPRKALAPSLGSEAWEARLIAEGVSSDWAPSLAARLERIAAEPQGLDEPSTALLRGALAAVDVQAEAKAAVDRNLRDVREVERLLGAFSGELAKLDEVLEVLSAYAQRMRTPPARSNSNKRILH